jgi:DNA polymerase III delta subunit
MRYNDAVRRLTCGLKQEDQNKKFILVGEELYLKEHFEQILIKTHLEATVLVFYPGEEQETINALYSAGLFDERIVILRYFDQMKNKDFPVLIKDFNDYLLITLSDKVNLKSSIITSVLGYSIPVQCNRMPEYGADYPAWILSYGTERGYLFVDGAEDAFYRKVGPDLMTLANEFSKLMIYKQETKTIYPEDIDKVVADSATSSAYDILDNMLRKDIPKTLKSFDRYLRSNEEVSELVFFLGHYLEKMYRILLMDEQKTSADGMADILNIPPMLLKTRYLPRSRSLGKSKIGKWFEEIAALDAGIRVFKGDKKVLFSKFIVWALI